VNKFVSLHEAIANNIFDGDRVAMKREGVTHLIPYAAAHEVIRQKKRDLTLIDMTPDLIYDQLTGMGCVKKMVFSWGKIRRWAHNVVSAMPMNWGGPINSRSKGIAMPLCPPNRCLFPQ